MKEEKIRAIGESKGVKDLNRFVSFLSKRFPDESDSITSYFEEWADRFNSGSPERFMDTESLKIYSKLIIKIK